jgi:hypothetical protein
MVGFRLAYVVKSLARKSHPILAKIQGADFFDRGSVTTPKFLPIIGIGAEGKGAAL